MLDRTLKHSRTVAASRRSFARDSTSASAAQTRAAVGTSSASEQGGSPLLRKFPPGPGILTFQGRLNILERSVGSGGTPNWWRQLWHLGWMFYDVVHCGITSSTLQTVARMRGLDLHFGAAFA